MSNAAAPAEHAGIVLVFAAGEDGYASPRLNRSRSAASKASIEASLWATSRMTVGRRADSSDRCGAAMPLRQAAANRFVADRPAPVAQAIDGAIAAAALAAWWLAEHVQQDVGNALVGCWCFGEIG